MHMNNYINSQTIPISKPDKLIAMTFDDGPSKTTMVEVLELLKKYDAKATFFIVGRKINDITLPVLQRAYSEGHELANHSFSHLHMAELSDEEILREYENCQKIVRDTLGVEMYYFRPPFGNVDDRMYRLIPAPFMMCGASAGDGTRLGSNAEQRISKLLGKAYDGCIALMHCFEGNTETVKALETILPELTSQGYKFVTLTELYHKAGCQIPPPTPLVKFRDNKPLE